MEGTRLGVVTGATAGIGKAIALALAKSGYRVVINSRTTDERSERVVRELGALSPGSRHVAADLGTPAGIEDLAVAVEGIGTAIDALVNNAGETLPTSLPDFSWSQWRQQFDINFFSAAGLTARLYRRIVAGGSILNVSSIRGLPENGREGIMAYSAAKAALNSFTTTAAKALAPDIRVNALLPGLTATTYLERATPQQVADWEKMAPIGRFISPDEIAAFAVAVIQNQAITGALLVVDGGFTLRPG